MTRTTQALVLVEPNAAQPAGHHHGLLTALARAHPAAVVIAPRGITAETRDALTATGTRLLQRPSGGAVVLHVAAAITWNVAGAALIAFRSQRWPRMVRRMPHQITALARCLTESAAVRTARAQVPAAPVVVLSAGDALHTAVGVLGGRHARFVHEINTTEDLPLRLIGRLTGRGRNHVLLLAPTDQVHADLARRFPRLHCETRPFAVADPHDRLTDHERDTARRVFGVPATEPAVCLVGGWWPSKDLTTIDAALRLLRRPLHLLVIGAPLDHQLLRRWQNLPRVHLHANATGATQAQIRTVYAAADASLLSRRPGVGKESGLVADAVRLGVPLIASDHDPVLSRRLTGRDWVRLFPVGDPHAVAEVLDDLATSPLPRPGPDAAQQIGVPSPETQAAFLTRLPY